MSRTTWRVLRTELLRGTAPMAAATMAVAGAVLLFNDTEAWVGRWASLAEYVRVLLIALVPLVVAAGAWQAGRERRRRIGEQLAMSPRPGCQPVLVAWGSVTLGTCTGLLLTWLIGAVLVGPVATYAGRGWWWTLAVAFVAVAAGTALGVAAGRLIPGRLVAPLAGVLTYAGVGTLAYVDTGQGWLWLSPAFSAPRMGTQYLEAGFQLLQAAWLATLAAALLVVAAARRTWLAAAPAAIAVAAAVPIVAGPGHDRWQADPGAAEQVCADGGGPEVCLARVNAFLLDDVTPPVRDALARWDGVPGGYVRAVDAASQQASSDEPVADGTVVLHLGNLISWNGGLSRETEYGHTIEREVARATTQRACPPEGPDSEAWFTVGNAARAWAGGGDQLGGSGALLAMPEADQRSWMGRYLQAIRSCDDELFGELAEELR